MWGMHNGSIKNLFSISPKHGITYQDYDVDSEGLFKTMDVAGLDILKEYEGFAALVWTLDGEPDTLYLYHGAYCENKTDAPEKKLIEERPLYYLDTPEGIYLSSMETSLYAIKEEGQEVHCYIYNEVHSIKNGKWTKFCYKVDRVFGPNTKVPTTYASNARNYYNWEGVDEGAYSQSSFYRGVTRGNQQGSIPFNNNDTHTIPTENKVWSEALPTQAKHNITGGEARIYFWQGRFRKPGSALAHGPLFLTSKGAIVDYGGITAQKYFFWNGVMLKNETTYKTLLELSDKGNSWLTADDANFACEISKYSNYPVTCFTGEAKKLTPYARYGWYTGGARCYNITKSFQFSSRTYKIDKFGYLSDIIASDKKNDKVVWMRDYTKTEEKKSENLPVLSKKASYDLIFATEGALRACLTNLEMKAMVSYCTHLLRYKNDMKEPEAEDIVKMLNAFVDQAVKEGKTLRDVMCDDNQSLEWHEQTILANEKEKEINKRYAKESPGKHVKEGYVWDNTESTWVLESLVQRKLLEAEVMKRYTEGRPKSAGATEFRTDMLWDTVENCWVAASWVKGRIVREINEVETSKERYVEKRPATEHSDEDTFDGHVWDTLYGRWVLREYAFPEEKKETSKRDDFDVDPTLSIQRWVGDVGYTKDDEEVLSDADGYKYVMRNNVRTYFEHTAQQEAEEMIDTATKNEVEQSHVELQIAEIISDLGEVNSKIDELSCNLTNDLASEFTNVMYRVFDNMKHKMAEVFNEKEVVDLTNLVNKTINTNVC